MVLQSSRIVSLVATVALAIGLAATRQAAAQAPGIMAPGDTIVTAFSGVQPAVPPYPSGSATDETFIDLAGPSMQIQRPEPAGPLQGQVIASPTVFSAPASSVGQVFAITLDDQQVPNIYLAATSAYGLQIVAPDNDGDGRPERLKVGQADATFMAGQWGAGGAPGSIYRVDGTTGAITLFTTIGANAGPGLGDIVFDRATHQFFVSDLDTGLIYRLDWSGAILDTFDHGMSGPPTRGLSTIADDGSTMDITDPSFNAEDPATWGYTQKARMVWGLAMHGGRLYYAVAAGPDGHPQIWSVGIRLDGAFAGDPRWELDVKGLASDNAVSDILFDASGRMILAQRGEQRGSYDYSVFAEPLQSSVVRYRREVPDDPSTPSVWVEEPDQYAIGFRPDGLNATGGIALGYGYDANGRLRTDACHQFLWSTGDSLRDRPDMAAQLAAGGPAIVHGLQGNDASLVRPANDPPMLSYFTDYDSTFDDDFNQGHLGDVEIWQPCAGYVPPWIPPPIWIPPPPDTFNLTLDKRGLECRQLSDNWYCGFAIRVSNTGTTPYWGPLSVEDWLPGAPTATADFAPQPPWSCGAVGPGDYVCDYPPVFLLPGDGVDLFVSVKLPPRYQPCTPENAARIRWPLGFGDANPSDDFDAATLQIPRKDCRPPQGQKTNLKIQKSAYPKVCTDTGTHWVCSYLVTVTNTGPGVYNGPVVITDTLSSGTPLVASAPWACLPSGGDYQCTHLPVMLNPGSSVFMWATTTISKIEQVRKQQCSITNRVKIDQAPGGSPQNTLTGDDAASAEALTPGRNCEPLGKRSDLSISKEAKGCIKHDFNDRSAYLCAFQVSVKNEGPDAYFGPLAIHDEMTPAPLPPSPWFSAPICAPDGTGYTCNSGGPVFIAPGASLPPLTIGVIVPDDGQTCRVGDQARITLPVGAPFNTVAGNDQAAATLNVPSPRCEPVILKKEIDACPIELRKPGGGCCSAGSPWNGKSCGTPQPTCGPGTTGTYPNCKPVQQACPDGYTGKYPDCRKVSKPKPPKPQPKCPDGYTGTPPNCVQVLKPTCPKGTTGTYPNCRAIETPKCHAGTTGTPPNCTPIVQKCPDGFRGTYPNCVRIPTTGGPNIQGGGTTKPQTCPAGTVGIFPLCVPQQQTPTIK